MNARRILVSFASLLATTAVVAPVVSVFDPPTAEAASGAAMSMDSSVTAEAGTVVHPFADAVLDGPATMDGITIRITGGLNSTIDQMGMTPAVTGIAATYTPATGLLRLRGSASLADYQTALRNVTYSQATPSEGSRTFVVVAGTAIYLPATGNLYQYVSTSSAITWQDARTAALAATIGTAQGHLVNITSQAENDVSLIEITGDTWIGATDEDTEGTWLWKDGPEAGQVFWQGQGDGSVVNGGYNNWVSGEPNQSNGNNEDFAHLIQASGRWNDLLNIRPVLGYLVEYEVDDIGNVASLVRLTIGTDSDGDGVTDGTEQAQGTDADDPNDFLDTDGDGVPDSVETSDGTDPDDSSDFGDTDGDGLSDYQENVLGTNALSGDSDGDQVPDGQEVADGSDPADSTSSKDSDGDGVPDYVETENGGNPNDPNDAVDADSDGLSDYEEGQLGTDPDDADSDGDGAPDGAEVDGGHDPLDTNSFPDADGDGVPDQVELQDGTDPNEGDSDGDGVPDGVEKAEGSDGNDSGDFTDSDSDGVPNYVETQDGTDPTEADSDGDGVPDGVEKADGTDPTESDSDGDGVPDGVEKAEGSDGADPGDVTDSDGDGVPDYVETQDGTDPLTAGDGIDTDGDGVPDYVEAQDGTDPTDAGDVKDSDSDGISDYVETQDGTDPTESDSDGDGVPDGVEKAEGTDGADPGDVTDSDGDGVPDYVEIQDGTDPTVRDDRADITGRIVFDADRDGLTDADEGDLSNVRVNLYAAGSDGTFETGDDVLVATAVTQSPFEVYDIPHGEYLVVVDQSTLPAWITLAPGTSGAQRITIPGSSDLNLEVQGRAVAGKLVDANGAPIAGATLAIVDGFGNSVTTMTDANGSYRYESTATAGLGAGTLTISVLTSDGRTTSLSTQVSGTAAVSLLPQITVQSSVNGQPAELAFTGYDPRGLSIGLLLLLMGGSLVMIGRSGSRSLEEAGGL